MRPAGEPAQPAAERKEGAAMENVEIARVLNEYADLLAIQGDGPFRVRAYRNAAQTVASLSQPVVQLIEAGEDLEKFPGIGSSMAEHIKEIMETGTLSRLEEVRRALPSTLTELMQLEHLGRKKARQLYDALGITSVSELAAAIDASTVEALPGFGQKSAANLHHAIEEFERRTRRCLLVDADQLVQPLLRHLRQASGSSELEVAGSYRRRQETVGDVDILAHPTGRQIRKRAPIDIGLEEVFQAAKEHDVALELDAQPERLDLNDVHLHRARELGVKIAIDSDAHSREHLRFMRYGIEQAQRGWLEKKQVVNTLSWPEFRRWLERRRA
jgi:DNA polymerase/3'-5' exonuclease PolX